MLSEASKREKVANALLGLAFATSAAQSPKDFVRTGSIESPGTALMQRWGRIRGEAERNLDSGRVSHPARNRKKKTFKEFAEESYLFEKTGSSRSEAEKYYKENPPFGGEPYKLKQKGRAGGPEEWRPVRAGKRKEQEARRRRNLRGLTYNEILSAVKRDLSVPNSEVRAVARRAHNLEKSKKAAQKREAQSKTKETGVKHSIDHPVPQQDRRSPLLRSRFQAVAPGDVSSNREVIPLSPNTQKGSALPEKGTAASRSTRSGAIKGAIRSARNK